MEVESKVDEILKKKQGRNSNEYITESKRLTDRIKFANKVESEPVVSKSFDKKVFGFEMVSLNSYIRQQSFPSSIYLTDKLIRLGIAADMEFKKKYLAKKRNVPMRMIWLIIIIFGIILGVIIIAMFAQSIMGG